MASDGTSLPTILRYGVRRHLVTDQMNVVTVQPLENWRVFTKFFDHFLSSDAAQKCTVSSEFCLEIPGVRIQSFHVHVVHYTCHILPTLTVSFIDSIKHLLHRARVIFIVQAGKVSLVCLKVKSSYIQIMNHLSRSLFPRALVRMLRTKKRLPDLHWLAP